MKVYIKVLRGDGCILDISNNTKILELKKLIQTELKVPVAQQMLVLYGRTLMDERTVDSYPIIKDGVKLHLIIKKPEAFEVVLSRVLMKYYTKEQTKVIMEEFLKKFNEKVLTLSLDDLERIATSYLSDESL